MSDNANTVRKSFSLDALDDHDLIEWLARQDNASEIIRAALRQSMGQPSSSDLKVILDGLTARVEEILRTLRSVDINPTRATKPDGAPSPASANLSKMVKHWNEHTQS